MMVFCLSETSDDEFEIAASGLGKSQGFRIEDSITSNRWEKTFFVNTIDGLIYSLSWKVYHDLIEEYENKRNLDPSLQPEVMNLATCATNHRLEPVNIHYMMNYMLSPQIGSFRLNKQENLLGFTAQTNKLIFLTDFGNPSPKVYTTLFLGDEERIKDF